MKQKQKNKQAKKKEQDTVAPVPSPPTKKQFYDWKEVESLVNRIANQVKVRGKKFDRILGIGRGGLIPAVMLSHKLNTYLDVQLVQNFMYASKDVQKDKIVLSPLARIQKLSSYVDKSKDDYLQLVKDIKDGKKVAQGESIKKVLIVDEVVESGKSLLAVAEQMKLLGCEYEIAVLVKKPQDLVKVDYYADTSNHDTWLTFAWEDPGF